MRTNSPMAKKPQQILFSKNTYSPYVKVEHWNYSVQAQKKDNEIYRDGLSNLISTYNRWGVEDQGVKTTETRNMLEEVYTKTDPVYSFKPLVNFTSYPCTDTPGRNKLMKSANLAQLAPDFGTMDYISTQKDDYRNPSPCVLKPLRIDEERRLENLFSVTVSNHTSTLTLPSPPWLLNRVIRSDLTQNYGTAPPRGDYQCLDTHTPIGHIRHMRLYRHQSFNPASWLQDFPNMHSSYDLQ